MFVAALAAVVATGCGPGERSSVRTASAGGDSSPVATTASSAPAAPVTTSRPAPPKPRPKPKPKPVAPKPAPKPVAKPKPKPVVRSTCGAPSNPWGYNFCGRGSYIYSPAGDVCSYFDCIGNFDNGVGYMVECNDGMYSMSGGRSGACSHHGGEGQAVYSGP